MRTAPDGPSPRAAAAGIDAVAIETSMTTARPLRSLASAVRPSRWKLVGIGAIFLFKDSALWLLPFITARIIDLVVAGGPATTIALMGGCAALLLVQVYPLHILFTRTYMGIVRALGLALRTAVTSRLQLLSIGYHGRTSAAVVQSKVVRDVENIELMLGQIGNPLGSAIVVFTGAVSMTAIQIPEFLPVFAIAIPIAVGVWWLMRRRSQQSNEAFRRQTELFSQRVGEMAALIPITRAHGLEGPASQRVAAQAEGLRRDGLSLDMINGHFGALSWVTMQLLAIGTLVSAALASSLGLIDVTPGEVVLLSTYFSTLSGTVMTVLSFLPIVARGGESARSLAEVLEDPDIERHDGKPALGHVDGSFRFDQVHVRYPDDDRDALDGIDLTILAGETVAFVGASGSGKSTLLNTLLGFVTPSSGTVSIDGLDLATIDLRTMRRHVSVVPQDTVLFGGSIRDNVTFGLGDISDSRLTDALVRANAWELVRALPDGWNTMVGERGARLSGGQRQRIAIARALIRDPRVLVLDEATSALDAHSEHQVQEALNLLMRGRTTLIVAHRLSTVTRADRIVVLEHGRIVETGTHTELLARHGRYANLWGLQFR